MRHIKNAFLAFKIPSDSLLLHLLVSIFRHVTLNYPSQFTEILNNIPFYLFCINIDPYWTWGLLCGAIENIDSRICGRITSEI